jgi:hypothetical protein
MQATVPKRNFAWQPLTARGVAAFAQASFARLFALQSAFAMLAAVVVIWCLHEGWFPTIRQAILRLPSEGEVRGGRLNWRAESPVMLAEGRLLSICVDLDHEGRLRSPAHVQLEFGGTSYKIISLFGFVQRNYPKRWIIAANRAEVEPWWGAWRPVILALVAGAVIVGLMFSWAALASVYYLPLWLIAFLMNRELSLAGSWRLAGAALLPGALLLTAATFAYTVGMLDLVRLLVAFALHFVLAFVYLGISLFKLDLHPEALPAKTNPFVPPPSSTLPGKET